MQPHAQGEENDRKDPRPLDRLLRHLDGRMACRARLRTYQHLAHGLRGQESRLCTASERRRDLRTRRRDRQIAGLQTAGRLDRRDEPALHHPLRRRHALSRPREVRRPEELQRLPQRRQVQLPQRMGRPDHLAFAPLGLPRIRASVGSLHQTADQDDHRRHAARLVPRKRPRQPPHLRTGRPQ